IFLQVTKALRRNGVTARNLATQLASQTGESSAWPTDATFEEAWLLQRAYDLGNAKLVHIFSRLNSAYFSGKSEPLIFQQQPSIEHIMPQGWIEHWLLPNGVKGLTFIELFSAEDGNENAKLTELRNRKVQTFGNLTILTQGLNSAQSHLGWEQKRPELLKHSLLSINQDLFKYDVWNENSIEHRTRELLSKALQI
ncbi:HNH endonuclease, partial [Agrobacterium sp. S2]|nr:HNH endonuclease [Agrobacterium sp. S2]